MDRYTINIAKSQIGFIEFIVQPTFNIIYIYLPEMLKYDTNLSQNKKNWTAKIEYYEEELKQV